jgi:hypothetical protein
VICDFVAYMILTRGLKHTTIKSYLASIAFFHKLRNWDSSACSSFLANTMLKGAKNIELYTNIAKQARKAMSYPLLKVLSHQVSVASWPELDKQIYWTLFTTAFIGSFRIGELIPSSVNKFNLKEDLLWADVAIGQDYVTYRLKVTKNKSPTGEFVDLFLQEDNKHCPVKAIIKLRRMCSPVNLDKQVFMLSDGTFLTSKRVDTLYTLLHPLIGEDTEAFTSPSFRAGIPSILASCPDIASQDEIRLWGRWSSDSYMLYTRLKTRQKRIIYSKILTALNIL